MRHPQRVVFEQIARIETAHLHEEITLVEAVRRLLQTGCNRHEAYLRLESVAVRDAIEWQKHQRRV